MPSYMDNIFRHYTSEQKLIIARAVIVSQEIAGTSAENLSLEEILGYVNTMSNINDRIPDTRAASVLIKSKLEELKVSMLEWARLKLLESLNLKKGQIVNIASPWDMFMYQNCIYLGVMLNKYDVQCKHKTGVVTSPLCSVYPK